LSLRDNRISDIQSIRFFRALREIYLSGNDIDDLSALQGFTTDLAVP
jgi:Leucine-rich repeat (LRR) protein